MSDTRKPFLLDGDPEHVIEIPAGEYYFNTKARCLRVMTDPLFCHAARVHACLEYHTMAFQQELAVKMFNNARVPLTPADVARETGLTKHQVRRAMADLEDRGLAKREGDPDKGLRNGHIRLYSWATPHPTANIKKGYAHVPLPLWFPKDSAPGIASLAAQQKYVIPDTVAAREYLLDNIEEAERGYQKGLKVGVALLERVCALAETGAHIRNERTERTSEINGAESVGRSSSATAATESDRPTDPTPPIRIFKLQTDRESAIEVAIPVSLCKRLHDTPTTALIARINAKLAGAPVEEFERAIRQKIHKITALGLLVHIAADVGRAWAIKAKDEPEKAMAVGAEDDISSKFLPDGPYEED